MKNNKELPYLSASELISMLSTRKISSQELLDETIARIESLDKTINAIPVRDFDRARQQAKIIDAAIAKGEKTPLSGLPMSLKESFNIEGLPTSWGNNEFKNWRPAEDALAVSRLKKAGAVIIGKSNVPFMLQDWQTYNDLHGVTNNPWDVSVTPGGSSGGSAAALAAGFVALEVGSDLAGSLRTPAHFCGIYTHKPTQNIIPLRGTSAPTMIPLPTGHDLAVAGPMARSAKDLELGLSILAGPDEMLSGKGFELKLPKPRHQRLQDFRVLVLDEHPLLPTAASVVKPLNELTENLIKLGVNITRDVKKIIDNAKITRTYMQFLGAFVGACLPPDIYEYFKVQAGELKNDDQSLGAFFLRGSISTHRDLFLATQMREAFRQQFRAIFNDYDVIICPVMPTPAFAHDHSDVLKREINIDGNRYSYNDQLTWISLATLFGLPATVAPLALTEHGLPVGVQIIGDYLEDLTTIQFAHLLEREFGGFIIPPFKNIGR